MFLAFRKCNAHSLATEEEGEGKEEKVKVARSNRMGRSRQGLILLGDQKSVPENSEIHA